MTIIGGESTSRRYAQSRGKLHARIGGKNAHADATVGMYASVSGQEISEATASDGVETRDTALESDGSDGAQVRSDAVVAPTRATERRSVAVASVDGGVALGQNSARSGGAISLNGASLSVEGVVSFEGNAATGGNGGGGAVGAVGSTVEIKGGIFAGNVAQSGIPPIFFM